MSLRTSFISVTRHILNGILLWGLYSLASYLFLIAHNPFPVISCAAAAVCLILWERSLVRRARRNS